MKNICLFLLLLISSPIVIAQKGSRTAIPADADFRKALSLGFDHIYNFEFAKADSLIDKIKKAYPLQPFTHLLSANFYWWYLISGEDSDLNRLRFRQALDLARTLFINKNMDSLSNEEIFVLINSYSFKSRLELKEKNYIKSVFYMNDCIRYMKFSFGNENKYDPFLLTTGLYNYFYDYANTYYPILYAPLLFFPEGTMEKGLQQLEQATKSKDVLIYTEANYFLLKINLEAEKNPKKASVYASILVKMYPANLVYQYLCFKSLIQGDSFTEAKQRLELINIEVRKNKNLTEAQKSYFLKLTNEDLVEYYSKNGK